MDPNFRVPCNFFFLTFFFLAMHVGPFACGTLIPRPGIEPAPPALEAQVLTTGPPGKSLEFLAISYSSLYKAVHCLGLCYVPDLVCSPFSGHHGILVLF